MSDICRLCKGTHSLSNLYRMDGDISLHVKITTCINLQLYPEDGFPDMICKKCRKSIRKFYSFVQKCLKIDLEFKLIKSSIELGYEGKDTEIMNNPDNDFRVTSPHNTEIPLKNIDVNNLENKDISTIMQCEFCGSICKTKTELRKHLLSHGETKLFQCTFCPKRFTRAESKAIHIRSHFGLRPFICEVCGKSSTKRQDLIRHKKIHNDVRNHECHTCGRKFKRSSDLCSHIRTHSGARPFKCKLCEKDYTSHSGLRKHFKTHNKKDPDDKV